MRHLFTDWQRLRERIKHRRIFILLDCDGTLIPIAETPQKAILPKETKETLLKLSKNPKYKLAIISGRALKDIKKLIGIKNIIYAGNHGLEIEGPKLKFKIQINPCFAAAMNEIKQKLNENFSQIKGAFVEDKGLSLSLHYRLAGKKDLSKVREIFNKSVSAYLANNNICVSSGKKVLEVKPPIDWDKGKIVLWLLARERFTANGKKVQPVYTGDDATDEDAFCALKNKGITIFVGTPKKSSAGYYLKSTKEVTEFLKQLIL